jgi:hypothetical protein
MDEEEGCGNRKSDVTSLGRKLKLHLLVYIIDLMGWLEDKLNLKDNKHPYEV